MAIGTIELILILVTLFAAIAGTVSDSSKRTKIAIIGLAILTSIGTFVKTSETSRKNKINEKLIVTLIQASNIPIYFSHDLVVAMGALLEKTGQFVSRQILSEDSGERILVLENEGGSDEDGSEVSGVLFFSHRQMNPIFYDYAIGGDLAKPLREHMNQRWTDCDDQDRTACLEELNAIGRYAANQIAPIVINESSASLEENLPFRLAGLDAPPDFPICFELSRTFIETLYQLPPSERGMKILFAAQEEIIRMIGLEEAIRECLDKAG